MARTKGAWEEGILFEHALRRIKMGVAESAFACHAVGEDGGWAVVEYRDAAEVVNPVARSLEAAWTAEGIRLEWVQETLVRRPRETTEKEAETEEKKTVEKKTEDEEEKEGEEAVEKKEKAEMVSVDVVLSKKVANQAARRDWWWVESKWTRGDHENEELRVVRDGRKKVEVLMAVVRELKEWRLERTGGTVYGPQRVGLLVVSRRGWKLELEGGGIGVMRGTFNYGDGGVVTNAAVAVGGGAGGGGFHAVAEAAAIAMGGGYEDAADGVDVAMAEEGDEEYAGHDGGGDDGNVDGGGGEGEEEEADEEETEEEEDEEEEEEEEEDRVYVYRTNYVARRRANQRYKETDGGYEQVLEYRWGRMGGEYGGGEQGNGGGGGGVAAGRMRTRSGGAAEVAGVTTVSRKRKGCGHG